MRSDADKTVLKEKLEREFHQEYNLIMRQGGCEGLYRKIV